MSSTDPFRLLELDRATATEAEVKAAYARLLKVTRPEDGREAFMALRQAFETARNIARGQDATRAANPTPVQIEVPGDDEPGGDTVATPSYAAPPQHYEWHHDASLNWHFETSPQGALAEKVIKWMVGGGKDRAAFAAEVSEALIGLSESEATTFRGAVIEYIFVAADPSGRRNRQEIWIPLEGVRPEFLTDDVIRTLNDDLGMLRSRPSQAYAARNYNTVLALFAPVLDQSTSPLAPVDVMDVFAQEQTASRKDAYGSYFDRDKKEWVDLSPVSVAMRDLQAAFDRNMWGMVDECREILRREDVQALDEFQDLDARLRHFICVQSGWQSTATRPVHPEWMRAKLLELLDDTFGWSRHFGRNHWERQQFDWLHKVIGREDALRAEVNWSYAQQPPPLPPPAVPSLLDVILSKPMNILVMYFGYRLLQVIWRLLV